MLFYMTHFYVMNVSFRPEKSGNQPYYPGLARVIKKEKEKKA